MTATNPTLTIEPTTDLDQSILDGIRREATTDAQQRVPRLYRNATVTDPAINIWLADLLAEAVAERGRRDPVVRTGRSLLLSGAVGVGKTHNVYGAVWVLAASGDRCQWRVMTMADAYALLRPRDGRDTEDDFESLARVGLLVLDDVGAAKSSLWTEEILYRLINYRCEHCKPTVITTNLSRLIPAVGERVASRLAHMCESVTLTGPDRRRTT